MYKILCDSFIKFLARPVVMQERCRCRTDQRFGLALTIAVVVDGERWLSVRLVTRPLVDDDDDTPISEVELDGTLCRLSLVLVRLLSAVHVGLDEEDVAFYEVLRLRYRAVAVFTLVHEHCSTHHAI